MVYPLASPELEQDPQHTAKTTLQKPVGVPQCAISVSRAFRASNTSDNTQKANVSMGKSLKKPKHSRSGGKLSLMKTAMSDEEEMEDIMFLFSDTEESAEKGTVNGTAKGVIVL